MTTLSHSPIIVSILVYLLQWERQEFLAVSRRNKCRERAADRRLTQSPTSSVIPQYMYPPFGLTHISTLHAMASVVRKVARPVIPPTDVESFAECLKGSRRILALLGAGISAASGLPTFRGAGGLWRSFDATVLATPEAFDDNPGLVWQFYSYRRHMALQAQPNRAHYALAELSRKNKDFITLSQNVDGTAALPRFTFLSFSYPQAANTNIQVYRNGQVTPWNS